MPNTFRERPQNRWNKGKQPKKFTYTYQNIADLKGLNQRTIRQYAQQGKFNPSELKSVIEYVTN